MKRNVNSTEHDAEARFTRGDVATALSLFLLAVILRVPFRSHFAYHWDSAQFALAVGEYNIRIGQPHAPGFYLYVVLGRLVNWFVGEPHAALVWLSVIAGAWLAAAGYLLATSMFGRRCGWATGLILLTSPLCWFHSEIALTTIVDSALVMSFVFVCWQTIQRGATWFQTIALAALLAAVGGVRQQSAPLLIPLWGYAFWNLAAPRARKFLWATVLAVGLSLLWFVPTVTSAGGFASYVHLLRLKSQFDAPLTIWGGGGMGAILDDVNVIVLACCAGLLAAGIISLTEFAHWVIFEKAASANDFFRSNKTQLCVLVLWIAPMLIFGMFMYVALPGHVLGFFPALTVLAGPGLVRFAERAASSFAVNRLRALGGVLTVVVAVNTVVFVCPPRWPTRSLAGPPLTAVEIRQHDADLSACFQVIRKIWPSRNVLICHRGEDFYWGFRQFEYYLPEYRNVLLEADASLPGALATKKWIGYERQTVFVSEVPVSDGQDIVLVVPLSDSLDRYEPRFDTRKATLILDSRAKLYQLHR